MAEEKYMQRAIYLASLAKGYTSPNPMVGAVIVHNNKIIGEGYHKKAGTSHAEVIAINSVKDKSLLSTSTIYVSLEPCSHYGKTPPCAQLIINSKIARVVVACLDPYEKVAGNGIRLLQNAGIKVEIGILEAEATELNKEFFCVQKLKRPYVYLKWAQTQDGFIDKIRNESSAAESTPISNDFTRILVHKLRAETDAILVGNNTILKDNPSLTSRYYFGNNPTRIILAGSENLSPDLNIFNNEARTIIVSEKKNDQLSAQQIEINPHELASLLKILAQENIQSIMVEGGAKILESFISAKLWDEAFVEQSNLRFTDGILAPKISNEPKDIISWGNSTQLHFKNR